MNPRTPDPAAPDGAADWLDRLLAAAAEQARPPDGDFSATVMRRLPPARAGQDAWAGYRLLGACAAGLCAAALLLLLPDALDVLARAASPVEWLTRSALERLLPPLALAAWMGWWSVRQAAAEG